MSKEDVLHQLENAISYPGSDYSGNIYYEYIIKRLNILIKTDRNGVLGALRHWLSLRDDPKTMLAVTAIKDLSIPELKQDLVDLRSDIESGKVFFPYYIHRVNNALKAISQA